MPAEPENEGGQRSEDGDFIPLAVARRVLAACIEGGWKAYPDQIHFETADALYRAGGDDWPKAWREAKRAVGDLIRAGELAKPPYGIWRNLRLAKRA